MGRLSTYLAAKVAREKNLPPTDELPNVSFLDALVSKRVGLLGPEDREVQMTRIDSNTGQPLGPNRGERPSGAYTDVKRDKKGKLYLVRHRAKPAVDGADNGPRKGSVIEKKKNRGGEKNDDDELGGAFTAEEDATFTALKIANTSWKDIAQEMKRTQKELKARWKEIEGKMVAGGDPKKNGSAKADKKQDGKESGGFSAKEDARIKEMLATNAGYKKIADALGRNLDKTLKDHIAKLKEQGADQKDAKPKDEAVKKSKEEKSTSKAGKHCGSCVNHGSRSGQARFTLREWRSLLDDEVFSLPELQLLSELVVKMGTSSWLDIASRFLDKTGRRVHPDDIKDKFHQMDAMKR